MRQRQHHRGVGIGPDRDPLRPDCIGPIVADRADIDHANPGPRERRERAARAVPSASPFGDLGVLRIGSAEHDEKPSIQRDRRPRGQRPGDRLCAAEDMRQKCQRRTEAVVARLIDKPARGSEEPPQLSARLIKMTGRRPALRSAHDPRWAIFAPHPRQLAGDQVNRSLPSHPYKRLAAASLAARPPIFQPSRPYHRTGDAGG